MVQRLDRASTKLQTAAHELESLMTNSEGGQCQ